MEICDAASLTENINTLEVINTQVTSSLRDAADIPNLSRQPSAPRVHEGASPLFQCGRFVFMADVNTAVATSVRCVCSCSATEKEN